MQQSLIKIQNERGYILIELAIVLISLGILMATIFPFYESYVQRNADVETKNRMTVISKAFSAYAQTHFRLPCPADSSVAAGVQLGLERAACDANIPDAHGIVPYRTLGLPEQYAKDGYGNFFTYVVSPNFTDDNRLGVQLDQVNLRLAHLVAGDVNTGNYALLPRAQFCAPLVNDGTDIIINQDGARLYILPPPAVLRDTSNVARTNNPNANLTNRENVVTAVAMALISHGENGGGAYQANGAQTPVNGGAAEVVTSDNTNRIVEMESAFSTTGADEYDDIVTFYTQDEIYAVAGRNSCEHL